MAKPKQPLMSLGARGTIADSLTFQKRGQTTIARSKPIPTDPESDAQLAQRQVYRDAVASWNSLTPEEKEAWRGVCRGLTAYQCFMQAKIRELLLPTPPEEYTEEQTQHDSAGLLYQSGFTKGGQRLTISNRKVIKLGFWLRQGSNPTGNVTFEIRRVSDDGLICSQLWGDASDLQAVATYEEVEFDSPQVINEAVRICVDFAPDAPETYVFYQCQSTDVKEDEYRSEYKAPTWEPHTGKDTAYRYKYYEV